MLTRGTTARLDAVRDRPRPNVSGHGAPHTGGDRLCAEVYARALKGLIRATGAGYRFATETRLAGGGHAGYTTADARLHSKARVSERTGMTMADTADLIEIDRRIAVLRDNLRQLVEQAAGFSGAEDEERNADRIASQQAQLDELLKQRDALTKK